VIQHVGIRSGRNPIPTPRISELTGRTVEHLTGPNGVIIDPSLVIHLVGVVIAPPWLKKFQLVQKSNANRANLACFNMN
jgi:hypothetical protein